MHRLWVELSETWKTESHENKTKTNKRITTRIRIKIKNEINNKIIYCMKEGADKKIDVETKNRESQSQQHSFNIQVCTEHFEYCI